MIRTWLLPLLALAGLAFAGWTVMKGNEIPPVAQPVSAPAASPYAAFVAGAGIIEASSDNISLGTPSSAIVAEIPVTVGALVKAGDALVKLSVRTPAAELKVREANLRQAQEQLTRLKALPRPEDLPPAESLVAEAAASLADAKDQLTLLEAVADKRAISQDELGRHRRAVEGADQRAKQAQANLALLKAGAWKPDLAVAEAAVAAAEALVQQTLTEMELRIIRAPVDGQVLQIKVRVGEFMPASQLATPLILLGAVDTLYVRVDVDENDAWRIHPGANAIAFVRGNAGLSTPLAFVRCEPYIVPKRSLTGDSTERVDTRVLQVLFSFKRGELPIYLGQQMDVFIDAAGAGAAPAAAAMPPAAPVPGAKP